MANLLAFLLTSVGLTVVIVWPQDGPGAWTREQVLRRLIPSPWEKLLDCYICLGFWIGLILSPLAWLLWREPWCWAGSLMTSAVFWIVLEKRG